MAIPFNLPSYEETQNNYRAMDELLAQLYNVLRQILVRRQQNVPVLNNDQHRHGRREPRRPAQEVDAPLEAAVMPDVLPRLPPPDVVSSCTPAESPSTTAPATSPAQSASHPLPPPRRARRRRTQRRPDKEAAHKIIVRDNWTQVGEDLRQYADEFSASLEDIDPKRLQESSNHKGISILSLLVPPSFRGSVWMAVIFLFGWQALQRTR